jgi:hypothetical protein
MLSGGPLLTQTAAQITFFSIVIGGANCLVNARQGRRVYEQDQVKAT